METKKTGVRGKLWVKVLAALLALILGAGAIAAGGEAILLKETGDRYGGVTDTSAFYSYYDQLKSHLFYVLYDSSLTKNGRIAGDRIEQMLSPKNTNFRMMIVDDQTGEVIATNDAAVEKEGKLKNGQLPDAIKGEPMQVTDVSRWEIGEDRLLNAYLDMNTMTDWVLKRGSTGSWAIDQESGRASAYYYDRLTIQAAEEDNGVLRADMTERLTELLLRGEELMAAGESRDMEIQTDGISETDVPAVEEETAETVYPAESDGQMYYFYYTGVSGQTYSIYGWVDTSFPVMDDLSDANDRIISQQTCWKEWGNTLIAVSVGCAVAFLALLCWLAWAVGWNREGVLALRGGARTPVEPAAIFCGCTALIPSYLGLRGGMVDPYGAVVTNLLWGSLMALFVSGSIVAFWMLVADQCKNRMLWKNSLLGRLWAWIGRLFGKGKEKGSAVVANWPIYKQAILVLVVYSLAQYVWSWWVVMDLNMSSGLAEWFINSLPLILVGVGACKWAWDYEKIRIGLRHMAEGDLDYEIPTVDMLPPLKRQAQSINDVNRVMSLAVEERMKSQRFKTELITNVSHDLKTPLTSIINYVDLLKKADIQDETVRGYIEVLDRKSQRLKTLTEDLVEASKAASGTVAVQLEPLDPCQLVNQAVAEYEDRLINAALTPIISCPPEPFTISADGRHLWRILDNLLGNCTKYAMPNTRVYLDIGKTKKNCTIAVKNISADPLNMPPDELMKRFVRGDSARSTEGSGLGLSIARNLTTAQGGTFDLVVDGDLFKAVITFPLSREPENTVPDSQPPQTAQEPEQHGWKKLVHRAADAKKNWAEHHPPKKHEPTPPAGPPATGPAPSAEPPATEPTPPAEPPATEPTPPTESLDGEK